VHTCKAEFLSNCSCERGVLLSSLLLARVMAMIMGEDEEGEGSAATVMGLFGYQMAALPEFDEVFRAVQRTQRQAELP
jgi:hypothetical protein